MLQMLKGRNECDDTYIIKCMEYLMDSLDGAVTYHIDQWGSVITHSDTDLIRLILYMGNEL